MSIERRSMAARSPPVLSMRNVRLGLQCASIAANALCAGGIFLFPLIAPALSEHLKLTQPQLTTIALAGMSGQYPFAAFVGKAIDHYGPWACSLASGCFFSVAFSLFSWEIAKTPDDITAPSFTSFERLAFFYFLAGLGTVTSYFSSLFSASKTFPEYIGIASGFSMALFGLSPLFLSVLASAFFTSEETGLDVTRFMAFLAVLTGLVHIIGAINLRTPREPLYPAPSESSHTAVASSSSSDTERSSDSDATASERTPLLKGKGQDVEVQVVPVQPTRPSENQSVMEVLSDPYFWILAVITFICLGSSEMVISNIGSIALSLPCSASTTIIALSPSSVAACTSLQVRLLSVSNTFSRLVVGPLADFVSPVASYMPCGTVYYARKHRVSRVVFLTVSSVLLMITFAWMILGIRTQEQLWMLSIGTGIAYGAVFTVLPSIISSIWGLQNLGRNFGVITNAPFIGTPTFSYLYAFISAANVKSGPSSSMPARPDSGTYGALSSITAMNTFDGPTNVCRGPQCWQATFGVTMTTAFVSLCCSLILWRKWKGRM